jgi:hypothetical protein
MGMGGQRQAPVALPPRKRPVTHFIGGCVGWSGLVRKKFSSPGFDPRTFQPVAIGYTDCAIPPLQTGQIS